MPPERHAQGLTPGRAAALGALHGPAELLPISSSGHVELVATLAGWGWADLAPDVRKAFEVALHAGTLAGLYAAPSRPPRPRAWVAALSFVPPAVVGLALEDAIEQRLGGPHATAVGLLAGSAVLLAARRRPGDRTAAQARPADALALGVAQALALVPGLSRSGMTWAAARHRGFGPHAAQALSWEAATPVVVGATMLKGVRLAQRGLPPHLRRAFAAGAIAAAATARLAAPLSRRSPPIRRLALERTVLACVTLRRL